MRAAVFCLFVITFCPISVLAENPNHRALIVGDWEMILPPELQAARTDLRILLTFTEGGKTSMRMEGDSKRELEEGSWSIEGEKLHLTQKKNGKDTTEIAIIKLLNSTSLTLGNNGKDMAFRRIAVPKGMEISLKALKGRWSIPGQGGEIEFAGEGKMILHVENSRIEGQFSLEKEMLSFTIRIGGNVRKQTLTIKALDEKKLTTVDENGRVEELKRVK